MSKNIFAQENARAAAPFCSALVAGVFDDGVSLFINGDDVETKKHYQLLKPVSVTVGDKVLCAKIGDSSYVVLGALGTPLSPFHSGSKLSFFGYAPTKKRTVNLFTGPNTSNENLRSHINKIIEALKAYGLF